MVGEYELLEKERNEAGGSTGEVWCTLVKEGTVVREYELLEEERKEAGGTGKVWCALGKAKNRG